MREKKDIITLYKNMNPEERIRFIFNHYKDLENIIAGYELKMRIELKSELDHARSIKRLNYGGIGNGSAGLSNPTFNMANAEWEIDQAIESGVLCTDIFEDKKIANRFKSNAETLYMMRNDFKMIKAGILMLGEDANLLTEALEGNKTIRELADKYNITEHSYRNKLCMLKNQVIEILINTNA